MYQATYAMLVVLKQGGLGSGGLNFDAKLRRGSTDSQDLLYAHIGGMDTVARGLITAQKIIDDGLVEKFISHFKRNTCKDRFQQPTHIVNAADIRHHFRPALTLIFN